MQVQNEMMEQQDYQPTQDYDYNEQEEQYYQEEESIPIEEEPSPSILSVQALPDIIHQDVMAKQVISCMGYGPTLQLYSLTRFNSEDFDSLIDTEETGRRLVNYAEGFKLSSNQEQCALCGGDEKILENTCRHAYCLTCWDRHISDRICDLTHPQLFPFCPTEGCPFFIDYQILEVCWIFHPDLKSRFQRLLCIKYCQNSTIFKVCPNLGCGKVINTTSFHDSCFTCECGKEICRICGEYSHQPLDCSDMEKWENQQGQNDVVFASADQKQEMKHCPSCSVVCIKKVDDINIETICQCGHGFCWYCRLPMSRHVEEIDGISYVCQLKPDQDNKQQVRFLTYTEICARLDAFDGKIQKTLSIDINSLKKALLVFMLTENSSNILVQLRDFIVEALELVKRCHVYIFLEMDGFMLLEDIMRYLNTSIKTSTDYLEKILPTWIADQSRADSRADMTQREIFKQFFLKEKKDQQEFMNKNRRIMKKVKQGKMLEAHEAIDPIERKKLTDLFEGY